MTQWFLFSLGDFLFWTTCSLWVWFDFIISGNFFISSSPVWTCGDFVHPPINPPFWGDVNASQPDLVLDRNQMRPLIWYSWAVNMWLTLDNFPRLESKHEIEKGVRLFEFNWQHIVTKCDFYFISRCAWFLAFAIFLNEHGLSLNWFEMSVSLKRSKVSKFFIREVVRVLIFQLPFMDDWIVLFMFGVPCFFLLNLIPVWHNTRWVLKLWVTQKETNQPYPITIFLRTL